MTRTWLLLLSLTTVSLLSACAGKQIDTVDVGPQYCYTDENIEIENGKTVSSRKSIDCTDKPRVEHFVKAQGMAQDCTPYEDRVNINGRTAYVKGFICGFPTADGSINYEAVDARYSY
jgi:hypothetical protein